MSALLGDRLLALCAEAQEPVLLVAPFIKADAFARILAATPKELPITCVTRWRPDEVAAGVSDLEVFNQIAAWPNGRLFLHPHLHAKFFKAGRSGLLGSANLTGRALGWAEPANLELLVEVDPNAAHLQAFEALLFSSVLQADEGIRQAVAAAAAALKATLPRVPAWACDFAPGHAFSSAFWLPTCPRPDLLFRVYNETIGDLLLANARKLGDHDLAYLGTPPSLSEAAFNSYVGAMLRQVRWIQDLDRLTNLGLTDHVAAETIGKSLPKDHDFSPEDLWSVTKEWLVYFYPDQYERVPAGEMLRKRRKAI